jgi:hypothetical protein
MPFIKFTSDQIVGRLRWVMIGAMLFSMVNTLSGQPESFWHHPETAIRGDGLSIHDKTNHTFEFYLGQGWPAYLGASLLYLLAAFLAVSVLPRMAALITIFSLLFGHFFGASNWLAVRWQRTRPQHIWRCSEHGRGVLGIPRKWRRRSDRQTAALGHGLHHPSRFHSYAARSAGKLLAPSRDDA